ncbi:MAG: ABC transporter permease [Chloroflexi bacterium]|nr:ABC transporter permease [Chloroflexota bacterium]
MAEAVLTNPVVVPEAAAVKIQRNESYFQLLSRRFLRSKPAIVGGAFVLMLGFLAIFAEFFAPYPLDKYNSKNSFIPPSSIHFRDKAGNFHWRPFTYNQVVELDPKTYVPIWTNDESKLYPIRLFVRGWNYKLLGLIPTNIHLFGLDSGGEIYLLGTDQYGSDLWSKACEAGRISLSLSLIGTLISVVIGSLVGVASGYYGGWTDMAVQRFVEFITAFPQLALWLSLVALVPRTWDSFRVFLIIALIFALLSWTTLAREVRSKVLALRQTDFVLAAKEMGASDRRIMFVHLLPNTLSHIIVVLTLTIPDIILAEAFLSFLGLGIQRPLISWGLLMQDAQNLRTLGETPWIMSPALFIIMAVLGFNLLGDGLRDAADPYSIV